MYPEALSDSPVTPTYHLYIDDSGSRDLDRNLDAQNGSKWFALGGILIREDDEADARAAHARFCERWDITYPLHSYDIRTKVNEFAWINTLSQDEMKRFYGELGEFLLELPVLGTACVIDRGGYNAKYRAKYGERRWKLCKTAFTIVAERAAKYAFAHDCRMKIFYERCTKQHDAAIEAYFRDLRDNGMPFDPGRSEKYEPFGQAELRHTLWDIKKKFKSSVLMQVADLYLFPMCVGGYDPNYRAYAELRQRTKIIDCVLDAEQIPKLGVKYSCFEAR